MANTIRDVNIYNFHSKHSFALVCSFEAYIRFRDRDLPITAKQDSPSHRPS